MILQVYLVAFAVQWNNRMDSLRVAGGQGRKTSCMDARQIQRMNQQAEVLFGKEHLLETNFAAPMPDSADPDEGELLRVEYAMCQSTNFMAKSYYAKIAEEEQSREEKDDEETAEQGEEETEDEGVEMSAESEDDPIDSVSREHTLLIQGEQVKEEDSPALQDVLMTQRHLHLPGIEEVERLALLLLILADNSDQHLVPADLRQKIIAAASSLHEHDKTVSNFVKKYESRWGYTLFGRCLGADSPETSAAQKTKFGWMRYPQAAQVTEDSRLLYLIIKMLKNRPPASQLASPSKVTTCLKGQYKRIADRVRDDPILANLSIPLPNINNKSISNFISREEKKANYMATVLPKTKPHKTVLSDQPVPEAPDLPSILPQPDRPQVQYQHPRHVTGRRRGEKRRLNFEEPEPVNRPICQESASAERTTLPILPKPATADLKDRPFQPKPGTATFIRPSVAGAPVLLVVPAQPQAPNISFNGPSCSQSFTVVTPPAAPTNKPVMPNQSRKPCSACQVPQCGGQRKRYTPSKVKAAGSSQKIFTYCPVTRKSTTSGFEGVVYTSYEHFKSVVDEELERRKNEAHFC
ncbi:uncharacterized protein LOC117804919 [Xyrichtys novacula]|uniref:Uncharacterized protein LOC117804919 n=1 Tax=Xyrichtys novacula TaxID=13765 RepID=A0AAV1H551_XYRNO|nr:uncharacterized protein LOC117804919 [Xyrichtys novacula]